MHNDTWKETWFNIYRFIALVVNQNLTYSILNVIKKGFQSYGSYFLFFFSCCCCELRSQRCTFFSFLKEQVNEYKLLPMRPWLVDKLQTSDDQFFWQGGKCQCLNIYGLQGAHLGPKRAVTFNTFLTHLKDSPEFFSYCRKKHTAKNNRSQRS